LVVVMSNLACVQEPARLALAGARAPRPHRLRLTISRLLAAGIVTAAAACQFNPSGQIGSGDGGGGIPDARDVVPDDGDPGQPDANCNIWPFVPKHFDACGPGKPVRAPDLLFLDLEGEYTYNTDTGELTYPGGAPVSNPPVTTEEREVRTIWANGVIIEDRTTLRVQGARPLMIVSTMDINVRGTIDVSSKWNATTKMSDEGAGFQPDDCTATPSGAGGACNEGGGGGGGGGFSGGGGEGGDGGGGRTCDDTQRMGGPGGSGGRILTSPPSRIRGGCAGERGGNGDAAGLYGLGGAGGGAVHLVSMTRIRVEGAIHAGGAGGAGAEDRRSGGGGGGSGGFIGLEAPDIDIDRDAILAANGGGGGGGTNGGPKNPGEDGLLSDTAAGGSDGDGTGDGGDGSAGTDLDGAPGGNGDRGGGGSGGGAGFIVLYHANPVIDGGATISPQHKRQ
jgi:hypothetical protein